MFSLEDCLKTRSYVPERVLQRQISQRIEGPRGHCLRELNVDDVHVDCLGKFDLLSPGQEKRNRDGWKSAAARVVEDHM